MIGERRWLLIIGGPSAKTAVPTKKNAGKIPIPMANPVINLAFLLTIFSPTLRPLTINEKLGYVTAVGTKENPEIALSWSL